MNKIFTFIALFATTFVFSQGFVNNSFEQWTSGGTYEEPANWATLNPLSFFAPGFPITAEKSTDVHSGQYALKLTTKAGNPDFTPFPEFDQTFTKDTFPGLAILGGQIGSPVRGIPFNWRPEIVNFMYKYTSVGGDSAGLIFMLSKWDSNTNQRITVGGAMVSMNATVNSYTGKNVPLQFVDSSIPDTLTIIAFSSFDALYLLENSTPVHAAIPGSTLLIDDISMLVTGMDENTANGFDVKLYPNPATNELSIYCVPGNSVNVEFYDMKGRLVHAVSVNQMLSKTDVSGLPSGIYVYKVKKGNSILRTGKFTIAG